MQGRLLNPGEMALNSAASFPHEHLTHPGAPGHSLTRERALVLNRFRVTSPPER